MPDGDATYQSCPTCQERKLTPSYFCSRACQQEHWPRHKKWHKEQKEHLERYAPAVQERSRSVAEGASRIAEETGSEYVRIVAEGMQLSAERDYRKAARSYRKAIKLEPNEPVAYYNLGNALGMSGSDAQACQMFLKAGELFPDDSKDWAKAIAKAFYLLLLPACAEVVKPEWWNDVALKMISTRVKAAAPDDLSSCEMRAYVMGGAATNVPWEAGSRSVAELREAARCFLRLQELDPARKETHINNASYLNSQAERQLRSLAQFAPGVRVQLCGLLGRTELNGAAGQVFGCEDAVSGRIPVRLVEPIQFAGETVKLKLENIR